MTLHLLRGMNDILPDEIPYWREIEETARSLFGLYGYEEIRTPILEDMTVFTRTIGDTTNIVEKEMYVFQDRNEKWVAMRPEGTASVVRAYIEHNRFQEDPVARYLYLGPMYRYEKPQKGRFRQFHQLGAEVFGIASPKLDAEVIHLVDVFFQKLGIPQVALEINSLGCTMCRPNFLAAFFNFLHKNEDRLCSDCKRRMEKNPLRALDCNQEGCQALTAEGPSIQDHLCEECEKDFDTVLVTLGALGTAYKINPKIVRGLDYYLKTTFEFTSTLLGSQKAVAGGGRYDGLVRLMGGPNIPGFGFAIGLERLVDIIKESRPKKEVVRSGAFIATLGENAMKYAFTLAETLRQNGISVDLEYESKSLKSQMRRADKKGARWVLVLGDQELEKKAVAVRDMNNASQTEVPFSELTQHLKASS